MAYEEKTDWLPDDPINEDDVNRWEKGIKDAHKDLAAHKNDMNNPHKTTKAQIGLGNVDNVQQAAKKDFDQHNQDQDRHVTKAEKDTWSAGQLFKLTEDNGLAKYRSGADFNTLTDTGLYYMSSVTTALNAPVNNNGYLFVHNYGTYAYQEYTSYSSSDSTSSGRRKFMRNKISGSDSWTSWREFESVEGSQSKVDAHANKTDIHVTKSDKDKWNNAQLYKLTDAKGCRTKIPDGTDLLTLPSGLYFAAGNVVTNNPVAGDASWYNYDVIETGSEGRKTIIASRSYDGTFWMATIHTDGLFKGWNKIETETESQKKADQALLDAKSFVQENYSNDKLTIITGSNAITDARIGGDEYPKGITIMDIGQGNTTGYPLTYGIVKNERYSDYRFAQYFYGTGNESGTYFNSTGVWVRHWWSGSGWTRWGKISGFAHANIGTTGVQYLESTEHTKIKFNRKIKDSHNAFDINNNRFIAPNDGMYIVGTGLYMINYPSYINFLVKVYLNGTHYKNLDHLRGYFNNSSTEMYVSLNGNATVPMNKGDYLEIYCYCNYGGDMSLKRGVADQKGMFNFFDIQEIGGLNYPRID
ncbi:pyocin knob domain-containing protein [Bacillus amyloliquefaciens]|uniref:pyocin knob domain-containing protein n=1 Tax=Bacillus amyloliquefaciens TaxID=1390 RepID=UPI002DB66DB9|nr:pyocin knob domain-containing protein [Bacillus amyloliquefaciens]MEC3840772.1 pyocin knob domain-containing protein [Bacillus amyloliquefaciens]